MVLTSSTDRDEPMTKVLMCRQARVDGADEYIDVTGRKQCTITWGAVPSILSVKDRTNDETTDSDMRTLADAVFEAFEGQGMTSGVWIKDGAIHIVRSSLVMRERGLWSGSWLAEYVVRTSSGGSGLDGDRKSENPHSFLGGQQRSEHIHEAHAGVGHYGWKILWRAKWSGLFMISKINVTHLWMAWSTLHVAQPARP
ncbi:hypothetical protein FOZ60_013497 [Perkinsus olseni]|uniref:Uncharacterized protein n=1 Tax=Perkinsus olseni TaxID=32597 RepID=A0A7J6P8A1_PEROL|nr:hypothetical protein FOZ60_013497 [Perkinsus olseni]